jgi:phosphoglycolate phosphatase
LIENGGVSKENYALAFELLSGQPPTVRPHTDGRTDISIMGSLLEANGIDPVTIPWERQMAALVEAGARNRERLAERGHALPGAVECLARLSTEPNVVQSVLTGNVEPNAHVKLEAFGLDPWLDFTVGGFGEEHSVRGMLVPIAQAKAAAKLGFDPTTDVTVLVGDTTLDVNAGLVGGARVIAVASGVSGVENLQAAGADVVLRDLADVENFVHALEMVRLLGPTGPRAQPAGG